LHRSSSDCKVFFHTFKSPYIILNIVLLTVVVFCDVFCMVWSAAHSERWARNEDSWLDWEQKVANQTINGWLMIWQV
jgi:hypothetical protein